MGFHLARKPDTDLLLACEQAYTVLQNLPDGINLILLCAHKDEILASLGNLYWLINEFFYGGRAPIAFVVTHFDTPDEQWWERNQDNIAQRTGISVQFIPHACITAVQTGRDQSKQALKQLMETYATAIAPISPRLDLSSRATASLDLSTHLGLSTLEAAALVERLSRLHHGHQEVPEKPSPLQSEAHSEDGNDDLEVLVRSFCRRSVFSQPYRSKCRRALRLLNSTMKRLVIIIFSSCFHADVPVLVTALFPSQRYTPITQ